MQFVPNHWTGYQFRNRGAQFVDCAMRTNDHLVAEYIQGQRHSHPFRHRWWFCYCLTYLVNLMYWRRNYFRCSVNKEYPRQGFYHHQQNYHQLFLCHLPKSCRLTIVLAANQVPNSHNHRRIYPKDDLHRPYPQRWCLLYHWVVHLDWNHMISVPM